MIGLAASRKERRRLETITQVAAAIILSAAALLTSWASFQAALWDGEQAAAYARAGAARVRASALQTENELSEGIDLFLFSQWLDALARRDLQLQAFYRARFRTEFAPAFAAWLRLKPHQNPQAPPTPFAMPEYRPALAAKARAMDARADALFDQGQRANDISDAFVQATVTLALALFTGGISQTFTRAHLKLVLSALAACACVYGFTQLVSLPAMSL